MFNKLKESFLAGGSIILFSLFSLIGLAIPILGAYSIYYNYIISHLPVTLWIWIFWICFVAFVSQQINFTFIVSIIIAGLLNKYFDFFHYDELGIFYSGVLFEFLRSILFDIIGWLKVIFIFFRYRD